MNLLPAYMAPPLWLVAMEVRRGHWTHSLAVKLLVVVSYHPGPGN